MAPSPKILLDENIGRVFERVLREHGFHVEQAADRFGEQTVDKELIRWCHENDYQLITNNARDFKRLHQTENHAGLLLVWNQSLLDTDPEGLARATDEVLDQYGVEGLANEVVDLGTWYDWLHE